ncbi:hypothetical protein BC829DRAFT_301414 [Chytridium lagenaria]|nr:hypothetical protein BC829DRAFT_301414 [Chytridium lagenaria]
MSLSWELEIPEIASTVDLIDSHLHPSQPVAAPTRGGFPTINDRDPEQRQRDRENILMALRERGYDLGMTLRDAEEGKMGAANCLDDIAERFFRELGGVGKNGGGTTTMRTYRAPIYKAWEDQVHALQDRIKVLEQALYERDKECRLAQSREKEKSVELEKALKSVAGVEEERGRWRKALMNAGNDLDAANERGRRLEEELEIFKRGDVGRRHEGMVDLLTEKEEHVGRMRFVVATLQRRLEKVGEARRKERRVLEETLAAVKRLKDDHAHLLSDLRHHMQSLPLITSRAITPLTTQIRHLSLDLSHLRTLYRVDRRAVQLLRQSLPNRSTSPPVSVLCRVRPDERVRVTGRSAVTVLGDSEVVVSAKRGTRMFRFEKAFGGKLGRRICLQRLSRICLMFWMDRIYALLRMDKLERVKRLRFKEHLQLLD